MRAAATEGELGGYKAFSWGRAGVTYSEYQTVSFECASRAMLAPRAPPEPIPTLFAPADPEWMIADAVSSDVQDQRSQYQHRQEVVEACLQEFGFTAFGLTDDQLAKLATLPRGSEERRAYLHGLSSDPERLAAQHL
ncbi:MAG: hypothetical protein WDM79_12245 [Terricaulis sp.]